MATSLGISIQGSQILIRGITGSFEKVFLYLPDPQFVRPVRVGYYWYGASNTEGTIGYLFEKGYLTSWGVAITRAEKSAVDNKVDTLIVEWNQPGLDWLVFW